MKKLYATGFFERCACADRTRVQLWKINRLHSGEAEGLVQAQEKEARFFIVDETKARAAGENQGLVIVGTVRLLARLSLEGQADDARSLVRRLRRELTARIAEDVVEQAIATAAIPI